MITYLTYGTMQTIVLDMNYFKSADLVRERSRLQSALGRASSLEEVRRLRDELDALDPSSDIGPTASHDVGGEPWRSDQG